MRVPSGFYLRAPVPLADWQLITPPEATNTGPGFNRGSGGGARGCSFEERVGFHILSYQRKTERPKHSRLFSDRQALSPLCVAMSC